MANTEFYPIILAVLTVDSSTYCFSTDDWVQTNSTPDCRFDPVLEDPPSIQQQLSDLYFGVESSTNVSLDFLPITAPQDASWAEITSKHELRNGKINLWLVDGDADPSLNASYTFQYQGRIVGWTWKSNGGISISLEMRDDDVFDTQLPKKTVNTDDYADTALDIGQAIPMPFGWCKNVICPNICNDFGTDYYDYAVAYSDTDIEGLWEDGSIYGVRRDGILSLTSDYTFFNVTTVGNPYANTAFIRFSVKQEDGHYLQITADVKGPKLGGATASRNFVDILEEILTNTTVGLADSVDSTSFATAKTAVGNIGDMYCDGVLQNQMQARDYINQLLRTMRGSLQRASDGEWTLTIDQAGTSVQTFGDNDGLYNNCNVNDRKPLVASQAAKKLVITYDLGMGGKTVEQTVRSGFGTELPLEFWFVADDDTIAKVASYEQYLHQLADEEITLTVEHDEGGSIDLGDIITVVGGEDDYITNGDAETGATTGWTAYTGGGAAATFSVESGSTLRLEGDYSFKFAITAGGSAFGDAAIRQGSLADFEIGELYRFEFYAKTSAAKTIRVFLRNDVDPAIYISNTPNYKDFAVTTTWQRFVWEFRPSRSWAGANRLAFQFGNQGAFSAWFDLVSIRKVTYPNIGFNKQEYRVVDVVRNNTDEFNIVGRRYFPLLHSLTTVNVPSPENPSSLVVSGPKTIYGDAKLGDGVGQSGRLTLSHASGYGDTYIAAGKTTFTNTDAGFILGIDDDDDTAKIYIGDSTNYFSWDGTDVTISGDLTIGNPASARGDLGVEASRNSANLVLNPGFEEGDKFWDKSNAVITTGSSYRGSYCAKIDASAGPGYILSEKTFAAAAGERYLINTYVKADAGTDGSFGFWIQFRTASDVWISNSAITDTSIPGTSYVWRRGIITAPAGAAFARIGVQIYGTPTAGMLYIDEILCGLVPKDADIDALATTNHPFEANADVTDGNTINTTFDIYGDMRIRSGGDIYFYNSTPALTGRIYTSGVDIIQLYGYTDLDLSASRNIQMQSSGSGGITLLATNATSDITLAILTNIVELKAGVFQPTSTALTLGGSASANRWATIYGTTLNLAGAISGVTTLTASGELEGGALDINGNADISGTLASTAHGYLGSGTTNYWGRVYAGQYYTVFGATSYGGVNGTFYDRDSKLVTVRGGIITAIV